MKKIFIICSIFFGIFFLNGCNIQSINLNNNTELNQKISGLQTNIDKLNKKITNLKKNNIDQLNKEITKLKKENNNIISNINTTTNSSTTNRYRKIYSNNYSIYKKTGGKYEICLAGNKDICIDILQYSGTFKNYYKSILPEEGQKDIDDSRTPIINKTIQGKKIRKCMDYIESSICFYENLHGTLIMIISDGKGEGFHGGKYNPIEILKVIDL